VLIIPVKQSKASLLGLLDPEDECTMLLHNVGRARLKRDGTCAETRFSLSAKRTNPFKSAGRGGGGSVSSVGYWQPRCAHQR
jgi:hypothetical protein